MLANLLGILSLLHASVVSAACSARKCTVEYNDGVTLIRLLADFAMDCGARWNHYQVKSGGRRVCFGLILICTLILASRQHRIPRAIPTFIHAPKYLSKKVLGADLLLLLNTFAWSISGPKSFFIRLSHQAVSEWLCYTLPCDCDCPQLYLHPENQDDL